ncbi:hypothetical protein AJ79_05452 [Helicocarpus griseus UAMH5409]|uniref:Uncharacterized protein n=1 Tax=Helicocarpus griseus UAMH5409 TaxID=1447875 RepID=A0A2B7XFP4_9EURO|nr:hypothetical protein AJ79_05452 [Helicocarpus griseus UAMH5409]
MATKGPCEKILPAGQFSVKCPCDAGQAYKSGYLQSESVEEGVTLYDFPSELHRRYIASLLLHSEYDGIRHSTVRELCFQALEKFSPTQLRSHPRKPRPGRQAIEARAPEAQYQAELYRALHIITGGRCIIHSEFSYTTRGKVDFFLNKKTWGIEVLREEDRLQGPIDRLRPDGAYGSWKLVKDWVILDFCQTEPPAAEKRDDPNLFVVVFDIDFECYKVLNCNHEIIITKRRMFYA